MFQAIGLMSAFAGRKWEEHVQHVLSFEARMKCSVSCPEINSSLLLIFRLDFLLKACMDLA